LLLVIVLPDTEDHMIIDHIFITLEKMPAHDGQTHREVCYN